MSLTRRRQYLHTPATPARKSRHPVTLLLYVAAISLTFLSNNCLSQRAAVEADIRAALVHHLLRYSEWPRDNSRKITLCSTGNGDTSSALRKLEQATLPHKVGISVVEHSISDEETCDVLVIGPEGEVDLSTQKGQASTNHLYIICNDCQLNIPNAAIHLLRVNDRIAYNVNLETANQAGINFNTDLLRFANKLEGRND